MHITRLARGACPRSARCSLPPRRWRLPRGATDIGAASVAVDDARAQAGSLAADLEAKQAQMVAAQQQAAVAAARERQLSALLAAGEQRSARARRRRSTGLGASC